MPLKRRTRLKSGIETFQDPIHFSIQFCVEGSFFTSSLFFFSLLYFFVQNAQTPQQHAQKQHRQLSILYGHVSRSVVDIGKCYWNDDLFFANIFVGNLTRQWKWQSIFLFSKTNQIKRFAAETFKQKKNIFMLQNLCDQIVQGSNLTVQSRKEINHFLISIYAFVVQQKCLKLNKTLTKSFLPVYTVHWLDSNWEINKKIHFSFICVPKVILDPHKTYFQIGLTIFNSSKRENLFAPW